MNNFNQYYGYGTDQANISASGYGGNEPPDNNYPGIGNAYSSAIGDPPGSNLPVPVAPATELVETTDRAGGIASFLNFNQIKGFIDRMGGLDGIVNTFGKVQGFMKSVTQMAPMVKMLYKTFSGGDKGGINSTKTSTKSKRKGNKKSKKKGISTKKKTSKRKA